MRAIGFTLQTPYVPIQGSANAIGRPRLAVHAVIAACLPVPPSPLPTLYGLKFSRINPFGRIVPAGRLIQNHDPVGQLVHVVRSARKRVGEPFADFANRRADRVGPAPISDALGHAATHVVHHAAG